MVRPSWGWREAGGLRVCLSAVTGQPLCHGWGPRSKEPRPPGVEGRLPSSPRQVRAAGWPGGPAPSVLATQRGWNSLEL